MTRPERWLPLVGLGLVIGCSKSAPPAAEPEAQVVSRVFAIAQELEASHKTKQALAAYRQIVTRFPNTIEAREATRRIAQAEREAIQRGSSPNRR